MRSTRGDGRAAGDARFASVLKYQFPNSQDGGVPRATAVRSRCPSSSEQTGFSLLELLVVLFIIGVAVTFATLSMSTDHRGRMLQIEAERLARLVQLASQEAVMRSRQLGLDVSRDSYRFYVLDKDRWAPLQGDDLLRERHLPSGLHLALSLDSQPPTLVPDNGSADGTGGKQRQPPILILSSGELVPFKLTFSADGQQSPAYVVDGSFDGAVKVIPADAH